MTSEVSICKLALSHIGDEAVITSLAPPDETAQAGYCATFYPIARDALLQLHPWPFAVKRAAVAEVANELADDWQFAYALPNKCLQPLSAHFPGTAPKLLGLDSDAESFPFIVEARADGTPIMYTNVETATLRYVEQVTDPTRFSPLFVLSLARLLAAYLAGPIIKGDAGVKAAAGHAQIFERELAKAATRAANVGHRDFQARMPAFLAARGGLIDPRTR